MLKYIHFHPNKGKFWNNVSIIDIHTLSKTLKTCLRSSSVSFSVSLLAIKLTNSWKSTVPESSLSASWSKDVLLKHHQCITYIYHFLQLFFCWIQPNWSHDSSKFLGRNSSISILFAHGKSNLYFLKILTLSNIINICLNFSKSSVDKEPRALVDDLIEQLLQSLHLSQDTFQN